MRDRHRVRLFPDASSAAVQAGLLHDMLRDTATIQIVAAPARSQVVVGVAAGGTAAPLLHLPTAHPFLLGLAVAGPLLPDIDHPASWVGRRTRPVPTALAAFLGHHGIAHSALAVVGLVALLLQAGYRRGAVSALAAGYVSRLAADMLTRQGLRLACPLRGAWGLPLCRTGSPAEAVVVLALTAGVAWWVVRGAPVL